MPFNQFKPIIHPFHHTNSWRLMRFEHRDRLEAEFLDSPSFRPYLPSVFEDCYRNARKKASIETGLPIATFPPDSPFTPEQALVRIICQSNSNSD